MVKFFEDDRILANPYASLATVDYLSRRPGLALFRTSDIQIWPLGRPPFNTWIPAGSRRHHRLLQMVP